MVVADGLSAIDNTVLKGQSHRTEILKVTVKLLPVLKWLRVASLDKHTILLYVVEQLLMFNISFSKISRNTKLKLGRFRKPRL